MNNTLAQALEQAVQHHRAGRLPEAEAIYRQILTQNSNQPDALHLLGLLGFQAGHPAAAVDLIRQSLSLQPNFPSRHAELGHVLFSLSRFEEAIAAYNNALALKPDLNGVHNNLGIALLQLNRVDEAIGAFERAIAIEPIPQTFNNLGAALRARGRIDQATSTFREALRLNSNYPEAWNNLGLCLRDQDQAQPAIEAFENAMKHRPGYAEAQNNLASALEGLGRLDEAIAMYKSAIQLRPDYADAMGNLSGALLQQDARNEALDYALRGLMLLPGSEILHNHQGNALRALGRLEEARQSYQRAIDLNPAMAEAHNNLGLTLAVLRKDEEATAAHERAIRSRPDWALGHFNLAMTRLRLGDFEKGLPEYEWRTRSTELGPTLPEFSKPRWAGQSLSGQTLLLHTEQGFGDAIQFIRYAPLLRDRRARIILRCHDELSRLFATMDGIERVVPYSEPIPDHEFYCPLLSLPHLFHTKLETIPTSVPYLRPDPEAVARWKDRLSSESLRVGIAWSGRAVPNPRRSIPVDLFKPLAGIGGVQWIKLQKEKSSSSAPMNLTDPTEDLFDFADTAALIEALDLVIAIDTAAAHLAGALGKRALVLIPHPPDWRWMWDRTDSPWYPTMKLFRQPSFGDWETPILQIAAELKTLSRSAP